jgi:hypothetical protein
MSGGETDDMKTVVMLTADELLLLRQRLVATQYGLTGWGNHPVDPKLDAKLNQAQFRLEQAKMRKG